MTTLTPTFEFHTTLFNTNPIRIPRITPYQPIPGHRVPEMGVPSGFTVHFVQRFCWKCQKHNIIGLFVGRCCFRQRFHQWQHTRVAILLQHHTQCSTCPPFHVNQPCRHTYRHTSILTQPFQQRIRERLETVLECIIGRVGVLRHCVGPEIVRIHFLQHR